MTIANVLITNTADLATLFWKNYMTEIRGVSYVLCKKCPCYSVARCKNFSFKNATIITQFTEIRFAPILDDLGKLYPYF